MSWLRGAAIGAVSWVITAVSLASCGGAGPYGFSRNYQPVSEEQPYYQRAADRSYEEVRRTRPEQQSMVAWFGVVLEPPAPVEGEPGKARVLLSLRSHQDRHLCSEPTDDSCRVTVSERELGRFVAIVPMREADRAGAQRVWTGSLLKVYGTATGEEDGEHGPVLQAEWYRHWPPHYYVTTASARSMRR